MKGRLRSELPRKIGRLELTILFFNSDGKLIETQPVQIGGAFYPGGPTSFSGEMLRVLNLPEGWTWKVTVSDAYYANDENGFVPDLPTPSPRAPIRKALPVSPMPTAAKSPAIQRNHE